MITGKPVIGARGRRRGLETRSGGLGMTTLGRAEGGGSGGLRRGELAAHRVAKFADFAEVRAHLLRIVAIRWNAHQAAQVEMRQSQDGFGESRQLAFGY